MELWMKVEEDRTVIQDKTLRGEMEESLQWEGKDGQQEEKMGDQFLIVCSSYLLFYYVFLLYLLWLSMN